jgi:hypothetical protein
MAVFSMYLPPFAPDYSGVCSALFDLNGLIVIHDAAGCTGNYTGFDEPRWFGSKKAVFCSGLRETDAILGNEDKFLRRIESAARELHPDFVAFVGSPVPMVIGTDFDGLAREIEAALGIPAFGFATNGLSYYNTGAAMAGRALLERFVKSAPGGARRRVNILGATPLDLSAENMDALVRFLTENGWEVNTRFFMGLTMEELQRAGGATVNLAISQAGVRLGSEMWQRFGIPCVTGMPCGAAGAAEVLALLERAERSGENATLATAVGAGAGTGAKPDCLVIGDEVYAQSVKCALAGGFGIRADAAALFGREPGLYADTIDLPKERDILDAVNSGCYRLIIADPLICELVSPGAAATLPIAQYGVSSKLRTQYNRALIAQGFDALVAAEQLLAV